MKSTVQWMLRSEDHLLGNKMGAAAVSVSPLLEIPEGCKSLDKVIKKLATSEVSR